MDGFSWRIFGRRIVTLFVIPNMIFALFYLSIPAQFLLTASNGIMLSVAAGVCAAFTPGLIVAMGSEEPLSQSGFMLHGVVVAWGAIVVGGAWWYRFGIPGGVPAEPLGILYGKFMIICAAASHGLATGALKNGTPLRKWVLAGLGVSGVVLVFIFYGYRAGLVNL